MRLRHSTGTAVAAFAVLLSFLGCSRKETPREQAASESAGDFSTVAAQFEREAKVASTGESTIRIGPLGEEVDGRRTITASRIRSAGTTSYTLTFRRLPDRWVCCGATAEETEASGGKSLHRLGGDAIEIDQLIIWLGWRNTAAPGANPTTVEETAVAEQPIPEVTESDVERIAGRDFGRDRLAEVQSVLREYGKREGTQPGSPRVRLAILKFAAGDFARLRKFTEIACIDFRDVVGPAESPYPHFLRRPDDIPPDKEAEANREQYLEWLTGD